MLDTGSVLLDLGMGYKPVVEDCPEALKF